MPFSLLSDEALIAEAKRGLEALGVEVVIDDTSSSVPQSVQRHQLAHRNKALIVTSRASVVAVCPEVVAAALVGHPRSFTGTLLWRNEVVDVASAAAAWWRRSCADPAWRSTTFTCCACRQRVPLATNKHPPCQQCFASICMPCIQRIGRGDVLRCPECSTWYLHATHTAWGTPWDMPRPAPTRREAAAAAAAAPSSALPQRMAAAVGPGGWLRLPPQHQRMHPVDVLVDGVLGALDGHCYVGAGRQAMRTRCGAFPDDTLEFTRPSLSGRCSEGEAAELDDVRARLKQVVDAPMQPDAAGTLPARQLYITVHRHVARIHPVAERPAAEVSVFAVRQRQPERAAAAAPTSCSSGGASRAHEWELVQLPPGAVRMDSWSPGHKPLVQVAYLEPERVETPLGVRQALRDAHVRLGGTACGAKRVMFLAVSGQEGGIKASRLKLDQRRGLLDLSGAAVPPGKLASMATALLHGARMARAPALVACREEEALRRAGLNPYHKNPIRLEARIWRLEGLAWRQRRQRRGEREGGGVGWEQRGGAGRRGRRRREPGVVFELSAWGEERRALSHEEAAWVLVRAAVQAVGP